MSFKQFLNENTITESRAVINTKMWSNSSLCRTFDEKETKAIMASIKGLKSKNDVIQDFIVSVTPKEKYSESLFIRALGVQFVLYAANGQLRLGDGSKTSACKHLKEIDGMELAKALENAEVI